LSGRDTELLGIDRAAEHIAATAAAEAGVAAPIFDRSAAPIGAVGIAGPRERLLRRGREPGVAAAVLEAARGISRDLGAPRWPGV